MLPEGPFELDQPALVEESPPAEPLGVGGRDLLTGVGLVWGAELVLGTVAGTLLGQTGMHASPKLILLLTLASNATTFAIVWQLVCRKYGKTFLEGFALDGVAVWTVMVWSVFGVAAASGGTVLVAFYANDEGLMSDIGATLDGLRVALVLAVIVPPFEELYYRGFIQPALKKEMGAAGAIALTALWFAVAHSYQLMGNWVALLVVATMGFVWSLQRNYTDSLLPPLATHWCYNITIAIIQIAVL